MEFTFFIGIDVSKNELDFAVGQGGNLLFHKETGNSPVAIRAFIRELASYPGFEMEKAIFCMEHTGIYNNHVLAQLYKKKTNICLESALQIKSSLGNIRGKNDKVDAIRISEYAFEKREKLRLWQPKREVIQQLIQLSAMRSRLIAAKKMLAVPVKEAIQFFEKRMAGKNASLCARTLSSISEDLDKTNRTIEAVIESDAELKRLFSLITSVDGIGTVAATQILIATNEFKYINNPKKFACYSGVAPFANDSGIFKGKQRVSHMANKKVKTLLHMSALVAIQHNQDLKNYYQRLTIMEKKNKMSAINAVRNKLILRIFACVNQNRKYEKNYLKTVA